jgi:FHA domain-containing protein
MAVLHPQDRTAVLDSDRAPRDSQPPPAPRDKAPWSKLAGTPNQPLPNTPSPTPERSSKPPQSTRTTQPDSKDDVLWRSFLEGAGIKSMQPNSPSPELMREVGEMLSIAVAGIQSLVATRARTKNEMHADMTLIRPSDNNPLKYSPDAAMALERILQPPARGFLGGPAALREALADLESHQVGISAGMRAALEALVERFDPARIEAPALKRSLLERLSSAHRKARLWDLFVSQYHSLQGEARDDFERCFIEALREAYEAEVPSRSG